ncbi:enoyl-CoA hydratase-related protein [Aquibium sp. ELW1220]|uniref:enoyl-CoA hydratase-related protein n=1 Tax=Aquibium sp. ELW1220 TaxID=2976766 RepID=UPI0025B0755E|nr:enoyl-CoA hydratase-related protein [Aquibium sp. ELW1220]MDN2579247.1 enoyl-CoA hydratase-related protein [Aquibium sp. ELW1220]
MNQAETDPRIRVSRSDDGIVSVTIDRADKKNALTLSMWQTLAAVFPREAADPSTRVIVLTGAGADFCAGADIGEFGDLRGAAATARGYEAANSAAFRAIRESAVPTIAAIAGICFGGGFGIAAACDLRLATRDARFSVPAARLGLAYPQDAMQDIVRACGPQLAKHLAFTAARLTADQARDAGILLETVADRPALDARAAEIAAAIACNAPLSVRASKASIAAVESRRPADAARARELGDATFDSADYAEGRAAFAARRAPRFRGL